MIIPHITTTDQFKIAYRSLCLKGGDVTAFSLEEEEKISYEKIFYEWESNILLTLNEKGLPDAVLRSILLWRDHRINTLRLSFIQKQTDLLSSIPNTSSHLLHDLSFQTILFNMLLHRFGLPYVVDIPSPGTINLKDARTIDSPGGAGLKSYSL